MKYFSTFASGFEELAAEFLVDDFAPPRARKMSGAIVYECSAPPSEIQKIKYFKNSYLVVKEYSDAAGLESMTGAAIPAKIHAPARARSFSLVLSDKNKLTAVSGASRARLVAGIERATGLKYKSSAADVEFLMTLRDDGNGFLLQRITKSSESPAEGQLESHIAHLLVRASAPKDRDVFIDPFCGSGAIPLARAATRFHGIFAMDIDAALIKNLKARVAKIKNSKMQKSFFAKTGDFLKNEFEDNFADAIVTDPPWGEFQKINADFYACAFREFAKILKTGGRLVILTGRETAMPTPSALSKTTEYSVLIHGKKAKAAVYVKV